MTCDAAHDAYHGPMIYDDVYGVSRGAMICDGDDVRATRFELGPPSVW